MSEYMFSLPETPRFPVFGLGPQFAGFRWLTSWNDRQRLYTVTLGHGHPDSGTWVSVATYAKTPQRLISEDAATGPTGFTDALLDAVVRLGELGLAGDEAARNALIESELHGDETRGADTGTLGPEWTTDECTVDDHTHPALTRRLNGAWATLIDLPEVSISISGPDCLRAVSSPLADMSDRLDSYA